MTTSFADETGICIRVSNCLDGEGNDGCSAGVPDGIVTLCLHLARAARNFELEHPAS